MIRHELVLVMAGLLSFAPTHPARAAGQSASATRPLSRQEAVDEALAGNPQIAVAQALVEQARARVVEAGAFPDPFFATTLEEEKSFLRPRTATTKDIGVGLTVPFPGKLRLSGKVAATELRATELALAQLRQQVASQAVQAYDALLVAMRHGDDLRQARSLADDFVAKTEARYRAGTAARLDVVKAKVDRAQAENDLIANENAVATARAALNRTLGRPLGESVAPSDTLVIPPPLPGLDTLIGLAEASRPDLLALQAQREGARDATDLARRYWQPDLSLTLSRNFTAGDPRAFSTAASFSLPLFFRQHEKGQIAESRFHEDELAADQRDLAAQVGLDVRSARAAADTALRQAAYLRDELLPEVNEAYRIASTSYALGGSSALEVLDAKRDLLAAQGQYADALGAANDARASLELAVGAPLPPAAPGSQP